MTHSDETLVSNSFIFARLDTFYRLKIWIWIWWIRLRKKQRFEQSSYEFFSFFSFLFRDANCHEKIGRTANSWHPWKIKPNLDFPAFANRSGVRQGRNIAGHCNDAHCCAANNNQPGPFEVAALLMSRVISTGQPDPREFPTRCSKFEPAASR